MKKHFFVLFTIAVLFLGSCSITQEYHFNKDLSGNYRFEMKMGDLINMIQSMDTSGNAMSSLDTLDKSFEEVALKYKDSGAKNVKVGWKDDKTTVFINFDFDNIDDLNKVLKNSGSESGMNFMNNNSKTPAKFTNKGKRNISFDFPELGNDTISMKEMESMKDYISIETIFSFDRRIKNIDNKNAELSSDNKSIKFSGKLNDILNKDFSMDSNIKLKIK